MQGCISYLVEVHLLSTTVLDEEVKIALHDRPRFLRRRRALVEERKNMDVDAIESVKNHLSVVGVLLVAVRHLADGHVDE